MWPFRSARALIPAVLPLGTRALALDLPTTDQTLADTPLLALDFEMTGLDPAADHILSIGFVALEGGEIRLGTARYLLIRADPGANEAAVIHGLGHDDMAQGLDRQEALGVLLSALAGRVMLAHHALIETSFLGALLGSFGAAKASWPVICTQTIEQNRLQRQQAAHQSVRLFDARPRYGLPLYKAHHALTDALATAELFLAQMAYADKGPASRIRPWIRTITLV